MTSIPPVNAPAAISWTGLPLSELGNKQLGNTEAANPPLEPSASVAAKRPISMRASGSLSTLLAAGNPAATNTQGKASLSSGGEPASLVISSNQNIEIIKQENARASQQLSVVSSTGSSASGHGDTRTTVTKILSKVHQQVAELNSMAGDPFLSPAVRQTRFRASSTHRGGSRS